MNNLHGPFTFPPATLADDETGILGVGANWHPETLIDAYSKGIFPWPYPGAEGIPWFSPPLRAVLELKDYKPSKRLLRDIKLNFSFKANTEFSTVISHCKSIKRRKVKDHPNSSWITSEMEAAYIRLHELGIAHSVEVFSENHLVGGLYGVLANPIFSAESMFRLTNNASKASFHVLVYILKEMGLKYLDCQIISPHLSSWGVKEITRNEFLKFLNEDTKTTSEFPRGIININSV